MDSEPQAALPPLAPTRPVAFIRRIAGPIWQLVGIAAVLEVPGRRTGTPRRVSLIPVNLDGNLYLRAFGGVTEWARNLRAAGRGELRHKRRTKAFTPIEVEGEERDRVIARYLRGAGPIKKDFYRRPVSADHPTFMVQANHLTRLVRSIRDADTDLHAGQTRDSRALLDDRAHDGHRRLYRACL